MCGILKKTTTIKKNVRQNKNDNSNEQQQQQQENRNNRPTQQLVALDFLCVHFALPSANTHHHTTNEWMNESCHVRESTSAITMSISVV